MEKRDVVVYSEDYKKLVDATALKDKYYEIDERVEEICKEAFKGCDKLEEIVMPKKLKKIDSEAFQGCSSLTKLTLPDSVARIDGLAFCGCGGLTELTLPNSVKSIGDGAFADCSGLEKITVESGNSRYDSRDNCNSIIDKKTNTLIAGCKNSVIPNSVARIDGLAFCGCSGLTELTLPNSVKSIGDGAFADCSGLEKITVESGNSRYDSRDNCNSIIDKKTNTLIAGCKNSVIPNSVARIDGLAFCGCSGLTELTLPNSVKSIGDGAFADCSGLEKITVESGNSCYDSRDNCNSIIETETNTLIAGCKNSVIPNSVTSIGNSAFCGCSGLTELTLPDNIHFIEGEAFMGCSGLTELTLPNSVKSIGDRAFAYCSGLTELTLPNSVTSIGNCAFGGCSGLTELTLPNSITSIGDYAFAYCSDLSKITSLAEIPPMCGFKVFNGVNKTNCELIVPEGSVAAYTRAEDWNKFSNIRGFSK